MYCGTCPYCGFTYEHEDRDLVKFELKKHMKEKHREILLSEASRTRYWELFGPETTLEWYAGMMAARNIRVC